MKTKLTLICLAILAMVTNSCNEKDFDLDKPNVRQFVNLLKDGSYFEKVGYDLPLFSMKDIDVLIKYLDDTTEIAEFPANPISSKYTTPKILSECIMWTIEGIRLDKKYASLEPVLIDTSVYSETTGYARLTNEELIEVSDQYIVWYTAYKLNPSETLRKMDLLANTTYKWN